MFMNGHFMTALRACPARFGALIHRRIVAATDLFAAAGATIADLGARPHVSGCKSDSRSMKSRPRFLLAFGVPEIVACIPLSLDICGAHHGSGGDGGEENRKSFRYRWVREDSVPKRAVRQLREHRGLHNRHYFSRFAPECSEAQDLIAGRRD